MSTPNEFTPIQRQLDDIHLYEELRSQAAILPADPLADQLTRQQERSGNPDLSLDIHWLERRLIDPVSYNEEQTRVIRRTINRRITVITGGSGTGKTTITHGLLAAFTGLGLSCRLIPPTAHMKRSVSQEYRVELDPKRTAPQPVQLGTLTDRPAEHFSTSGVLFFPDFFKADPAKLLSILTALPADHRAIFIGNPADLPENSRTLWESMTNWHDILTTQWIPYRQPGDPMTEEELLRRIRRSKFRSGFSLKPADRTYIEEKGMDQIEAHAREMIHRRLSPAFIPNDGQQTPLKGHPVFPAQHATACCCRGCLFRWYHIPKGRELTKEEEDFVVTQLMRWIFMQINTI